MTQKIKTNNKLWTIIANIILILGIVIPFGFGCQHIYGTSYLERISSSCEAFENEAFWENISENGTNFTDCNHYTALLGSIVSGESYINMYTLFSTSAVFLGLIIVYNKK